MVALIFEEEPTAAYLDLYPTQYERIYTWYYKLSQLPMASEVRNHKEPTITDAFLNWYSF